MARMNIYVIGFMATGKSTLGRELARRLGREFIDLDGFIEQQSGKRITEIFASAGERFFRVLERKFLAEIAAKKDVVVSCGGGIVIDRENVGLMKRTGKVICLTASVKAIEERSGLTGDRPLLNGAADKREAIETLMARRSALYCQAADTSIDTTSITPEAAADAAYAFVRAEVV
jgi:shikimate kinase